MDGSLIAKACELARTDGTFGLNAGTWTGSLTLGIGQEQVQVIINDGAATVADASATAGSGDDVTISAAPDVWERYLSSPPPPGLSDLVGASTTGEVTVDPFPATAERHLAITRFGELLRHASNGTDPAPIVDDPQVPHGTMDAAVGRYIHLRFDGLDHRIYFEEAGQGIGLVCQHTAGADGRQWRHLLEDERVTSRFRVIVYDLPYHGRSLPPEGRAWWAEGYKLTQEMAMAVPVELSRALGLDRPVFIGSSVGGMLALDLARYHADDFRASIALEGGLRCDIPEEGYEDSIAASPDAHAAVMLMIMSPTATETARQETRWHYAQGAPGVFGGDINYYWLEHDLRGEGHNIDTERCAVHLLTGEYDYPTEPWSRRAAAEIPGSTLEIMKGMGHFPMSENHEGLMNYVLPILDGIADE